MKTGYAAFARSAAEFTSNSKSVLRIMKYCDEFEIELDKFYKEVSNSSSVDREVLKEILRDAESGDLKGLVVSDLSRFSRDINHATRFVEKLEGLGCKVIEVDKPAVDVGLEKLYRSMLAVTHEIIKDPK